MLNLTQLPAWQALQAHQHAMAQMAINPNQRFSVEAAGLLLDYSKNRLNAETMTLLQQLARERRLEQHIQDLLNGGIVNQSEQRPALHTALRYLGAESRQANGVDIMPQVRQTLAEVNRIATAVRARQYLGFSGKPITTLLHFGIGGSDLGPLALFTALQDFVDPSLQYQFFSYQDPEYVRRCLTRFDPATTLIIIASKSFITAETLANAQVAKDWMQHAGGPKAAQQIIAVTAKPQRAIAQGILPTHVLPIWDWVGGRYSVWSAMSLIVATAVGFEHFRDFLAGAQAMDAHFSQAALPVNMPVILGLIDVWYNNFWKIPSRAVIPYDRRLRYLPDHLQQLVMESLGKQVDQSGAACDCATGFILWGGTGTNSQHSFHQWLLQGNQWSPIDFILPLGNLPVLANGLAQSEVLMAGYSPAAARADLAAQGLSEAEADRLAPHSVIPGDRPSHTLLLAQIAPRTLGALLALYEHRVFVSSVIWDINAFDQWGVERGKQAAKRILADLTGAGVPAAGSSPLLNWIKRNTQS
jgi:glucose-6-phosphate isomerase